MDKEIVVVSRKWNNPEITAFVSEEQIGAKISLYQFLEALVEEMGNPTLMVTKSQLMAKLLSGSEAVILELKTKTRHL